MQVENIHYNFNTAQLEIHFDSGRVIFFSRKEWKALQDFLKFPNPPLQKYREIEGYNA
jgi:hypothetical protein